MMISRNVFARHELHRESVVASVRTSCDWCGARPHRLFQYRRETDGGTTYKDQHLFCCVGCFRSYHDIDVRKEPA